MPCLTTSDCEVAAVLVQMRGAGPGEARGGVCSRIQGTAVHVGPPLLSWLSSLSGSPDLTEPACVI